MESVKQTVSSATTAVSEAISGTSAGAQKEEKKSEAKDSDRGLVDRATSAVDAAGHKKDEEVADAKKENAKNSL